MDHPSRPPPPPVTGYPAPPPNGHPPPPGYPYAAPPSYSYAPHHTYNPRATFLRRFIIFSIILFIIFGAILFISWLILRPHLPEFSLSSLSISNLNVTQQRISGTFNFEIQAYNPNKKMSVHYDAVKASVSYKRATLSLTSLPPFDQGTRSQMGVNGSMSVTGSYVDDWVARGIEGERARGIVGFDVHLYARVWFRSGAWRTRRRVLVVDCKNAGVSVDKGGSGKLTGGPKRCEVGF